MARRPGTKHLLAPGACLALVLALAAGVLAQESGQEPPTTKIDEFGRLGWCALGARLDNLAILLQEKSDLKGYVIFYGPEDEKPGNASAPLWAMQDYLVNNRGVAKERLKMVYGGRYQSMTETMTELWLVPEGAEPPAFTEYKNESATFTGQFAEFVAYEGPSEGDGPTTGDATVYGFADALRQQPKTTAYVVAYSSRAAATGAWRRAAKDIARHLNNRGVAADRVKIILAGHDEKLAAHEAGRMQLWILPEGAPPPAAEAAPERRPEKAVKVGELYGIFVGLADNEKRVLEGLADVLRADEKLSACVIVRLPGEPSDPEAERKEASADDFLQLVERWKAELVTSHKIDQTRLSVIVALETEEFPGGYVETWVVPQGAPLPDPYPPPEVIEEVAGEEEIAAEENPQ